MTGFLLVRAAGNRYGLGVERLVEVVEGFDLHDAPTSHRAVRGLTTFHGRLVPLVHLSALLQNREPPEAHGGLVVFARCGGSVVALEVDDADEVVLEQTLPVPTAWQAPWASGVAQSSEGLVLVIDVEHLADRLAPVGNGGKA